ncbi:MAG: 5-deoxy-glucuronate isomerase [Bryobacteraceae bacterium]
MSSIRDIVHSRELTSDCAGELLQFSREDAGWEWMTFCVRRLTPGMRWESSTAAEESVLIVLGGQCRADWGNGEELIGERKNVFDGLPYALYLPSANHVALKAETTCEIAECRVPSTAQLEPKLIRPQDVVSSLRGGENSSRQIVNVVHPEFRADRLLVVEVYTPGGNWSSYPPHKHDVHNPPVEVDLDEIYYYRIEQPQGFAFQNLYNRESSRDLVLKVRDGDAVLVRDGYHPVVAGPGYDIYYLNFLAGSSRALAATEDPTHTWLSSTWRQPDGRLPLVRTAKEEGMTVA